MYHKRQFVLCLTFGVQFTLGEKVDSGHPLGVRSLFCSLFCVSGIRLESVLCSVRGSFSPAFSPPSISGFSPASFTLSLFHSFTLISADTIQRLCLLRPNRIWTRLRRPSFIVCSCICCWLALFCVPGICSESVLCSVLCSLFRASARSPFFVLCAGLSAPRFLLRPLTDLIPCLSLFHSFILSLFISASFLLIICFQTRTFYCF